MNSGPTKQKKATPRNTCLDNPLRSSQVPTLSTTTIQGSFCIMPRGKNYVNNHKGLSLAPPKKKAERMVECQFGAGCTRPDCIYRHPSKTEGTFQQSQEPCMPFLAGICAFSAKGCRKRHPPKEEADRLIAKYKTTRCRFGADCRTKGCLYIHPGDEEESNIPMMSASLFPPLASLNGQPSPAAARPLQNSAWKASPVLPQQKAYSTPVNYSNNVYSTSIPRSFASMAAGGQPPAPVSAAKVSPDEELNANAKEFVPGKF